MTTTNWARNVTYGAARCHGPASLDELRRLVAGSGQLKAVGTRHSFNRVADTTGDHVDLVAFDDVTIDAGAGCVTIGAGVRYGDLGPRLHAAGLALHNLASLPHLSVAGAVATATHGSGVTNGNLATAVRAVELVTGTGDVVTLHRGDADFAALAVGLGAFGVVTRLTLDVEPTYEVAQEVHTDVALDAVMERFDEVLASAYSVSLFTTWRAPVVDQVWRKRRRGAADGGDWPDDAMGGRRATTEHHPIASLPPEPCTPQRAVPGPWHERLPHFRLEHTPSSGDELQSELFVDRTVARDAFAVLASLADHLAPVVQVSEVRTVAADALALSPADGRDVVAFHCTWVPSWDEVRPVLARVEAALAPFEPRPHWGKLTTLPAAAVRSRYPRLAAAAAVRRAFDPRGVFRNAFVGELFG